MGQRALFGMMMCTAVLLSHATSATASHQGSRQLTINEWPSTRTGWSQCHWFYKAGQEVTVAVTSEAQYQFPNGEFTDRISDAANEWSGKTVFMPRGFMVNWKPAQASNADIVVFYKPDGEVGPSGHYWGWTSNKIRYNPGWNPLNKCLPHGSAETSGHIEKSHIDTRRDSKWFTRDNTWRGRWESLTCSPTPANPDDAYLCSKDRDFGSLMVHEFGHTMMIHHPASIDDYVYANSTSWSHDHADCNNKSWYDSMCHNVMYSLFNRRTGGRTLDSFDVASLYDVEEFSS